MVFRIHSLIFEDFRRHKIPVVVVHRQLAGVREAAACLTTAGAYFCSDVKAVCSMTENYVPSNGE